MQVLDGVSVDGDEVAASKDVYSGRLTVELLEEKIGVFAEYGPGGATTCTSCAPEMHRV